MQDDDLKKFRLNGGTTKLLEWIFRIGVLAVIFWMKSEFATKEEYQADQAKSLAQLIDIGRTLQHVNDNLDFVIKEDDDQEKRIRALESHAKN